MIWILGQLQSPGYESNPRIDLMSKAMKENWGGGMPPGVFLAIAGVLLVAFVVVVIWRWRSTSHMRSEPILAFRRIAKQVGLSVTDQLFLVRISHRLALPSPVTLLFSQGTFDYYVEEYAKHKQPGRRQRVMSQAMDVSQRLFGRGEG